MSRNARSSDEIQFRPLLREDLEFIYGNDLLASRDKIERYLSQSSSPYIGLSEYHFSSYSRSVLVNECLSGCVTASLFEPSLLDSVFEQRSLDEWMKLCCTKSTADTDLMGVQDLAITTFAWTGSSPKVIATLDRLTDYFTGHKIGRIVFALPTQMAAYMCDMLYPGRSEGIETCDLSGGVSIMKLARPWKSLSLFSEFIGELLSAHEEHFAKDLMTLQQRKIARVLFEYKFDFVEATKCGAIPTWSFKPSKTRRMQDSVTGYGGWSIEVSSALGIVPRKRGSKIEALRDFFDDFPTIMTP